MSLKFLGLAMIAIGAGLVGVTIWFWNAAMPDPEVLAPLEIMGDRDFVKASDREKIRLLNAVRLDVSKNQQSESGNN
ncbi:MAG: hypothetical protein WCH63_09325 [Actinomycetota bacterium]